MSPEFVGVFCGSIQEYKDVHDVKFGLKVSFTIPFSEGCAI